MGVRTSRYDKAEKKSYETIEHIGFVVDITSQYIGDGDTVYYAVVFNPETAEFDEVGVGWFSEYVKIDASKGLIAAYRSLKEARAALRVAENAVTQWRTYLLDEIVEDETVRKGKVVKVVKGRKVAKGTVGTVKVVYEGGWGWRVLLELADGTEVWTALTNVVPLLRSTVAQDPAVVRGQVADVLDAVYAQSQGA